MGEFSIKIAGKVIRVKSLFDSTRDYCRQYLSEETPDYCVEVVREDLAFEQEALRQEALEEGIRIRVFTDPFLDRTAIQRKTAEFLFDRDVLMTHGSTVAVDGKAYLFTAKCGTGKSTHTRLWRQVFGERAVMINDDKPLLRVTEKGVEAYGTPWNGKHRLGSNTKAPLKAICILERSKENHIERITPVQALAMLMQQSHRPADAAGKLAFLELLDRMIPHLKFYRLGCNMDPEAAIVAYEAMSGQKYEGDWK